ncbi:integrase [Duganella sp. 3397]|uniref:tyrosine-type recombinase/integrase n=1 Tax=Duganella sp. 3397 TaxID=2817732 RepID=UPI0028572EFF|nr:site-specific integrase [Duganella sp. 3397]MDR7049200.1 integrase [Duganella sp. 3397]
MFHQAELVLFINSYENSGLRAGAPALFLETKNSAVLFEAPTTFLTERYVRSGAQQSRHTWAKAAYALKSWFEYLQAIGKHWHDAGELDRINYRDAYLSAISPKTGRLYGSAGVRDNMTVIREFHHFCGTKNIYDGDIGITHSVQLRTSIDRDFLAHTRSSPRFGNKDYALPKVRPGTKIHPIAASDLRGLLNHVGPQAAHRIGDLRPARDRLICDFGWAVGLRLDEINRLTTLQFLHLVPDMKAPFISLPLTIHDGKGKKTRQVAVPAWLVMDALAYIDGDRATSLRAGKNGGRGRPLNLILANLNSKSPGQPITNSAVQKMFRQACLSLGVVETVRKEVPLTGTRLLAQVPKHSIHDLRHTYAVLTYHAERVNGNAEPWKKIQAQLGHSQLQTTIDTYLSHVEIFTAQPGLVDVRGMLGL